MNAAQFDRTLRQASLLPVAALLLAAGALFVGIRATNSTVSLIEQADQCISQATLIQKLMVDEESGLRGYQATLDPQFLAPLQAAEAPLQQSFERLSFLLSGYPRDLADLDALERAHSSWYEGFAKPVVATLQGGGQASDVELNLLGKRRMDGMRAAVDAIIRDSALRRAERIARWRRQTGATLIALLLIAGLLGVLLGMYTRGRLKALSREYGASQRVITRRAEELFASEQNLRTTLASIGDGVITCDAEGRVQMMNQIAQQMTGWTQEQASHKPVEEVFELLDEHTHAPADNPATLVRRLNRAVESTRGHMLLSPSGEEILIAHNAAPIRDQTGALTGIVIVFRDITEETKTQAALLANEKLAVAGRLAASISHEIHNPLESIANLLYLLQSGCTPEETEQFLGIAQQELVRVTQISRAMLGLYREANAPVPVDLHKALCDIIVLMESRFQTLGVTVLQQVPAGLTVEGFPAELRQVFTNLITNAAEAAAPYSNPTVEITSMPHRPGPPLKGPSLPSGVTIRITDNGPGIPAHLRDQLFRPFFTTKGEHGTGLGLWVSQGIIRKHGGTIDIESSTDESAHGTTISVFLADHPVIQPGSH